MPLAIRLRDLFLHTKPGAVVMQQSQYSTDGARLIDYGMLQGAIAILNEVHRNRHTGVDVSPAIECLQQCCVDLISGDSK